MDKCPNCGDTLRYILSTALDNTEERLPICDHCHIAFRDPKYGWQIIENSEEDELSDG